MVQATDRPGPRMKARSGRPTVRPAQLGCQGRVAVTSSVTLRTLSDGRALQTAPPGVGPPDRGELMAQRPPQQAPWLNPQPGPAPRGLAGRGGVTGKTMVDHVQVTGNRGVPEDQLTAPQGFELKSGAPFSARKLSEDRNRISAAYLNRLHRQRRSYHLYCCLRPYSLRDRPSIY